MASIQKRPNGKWRGRYRDHSGKEHARHFDRKVDAQRWLDTVTADIHTGRYVDPATARTTVAQWCATWLDGYGTRRPRTVRAARFHLAHIEAEFGHLPLAAVRPSHVRAWTARLHADGMAASYVYALHRRLSQIMSDAVHDGIIPRSPCSRRTSPRQAKSRPFVATTAQVWALHDAVPERYRAAVLLGAFVGLRTGEACGLRVGDIDFLRGVVHPHVQYPADPLKTEVSRTAVPIPRELAEWLSAHVARWSAGTFLTNAASSPCHPETLRQKIRDARGAVDGLPAEFRYHDLRHYFASLLIASGADVKVVQARLRHSSAKTTLDTYGHLWPDSDESTRAAVAAVLDGRADRLRTGGEST